MKNKCYCLACKTQDYYDKVRKDAINNLPVKHNWLFSEENSVNSTYQYEKTALVDEK